MSRAAEQSRALVAEWASRGWASDLRFDPDAPAPHERPSHGARRILPRLDGMRRRLGLLPDEPVERHCGAYWWGVVRLGNFAEARAALRRLATGGTR